MDFTKILDWLKLSPRYLIPIALVTGFAIFSSDTILNTFGITSLVNTYRGYIGAVFIISFVLAFTEGALLVYRPIAAMRAKAKAAKKLEDFLQKLTHDEKRILRQYIDRQKKTAYFDIEDGVVGGLEDHGIIYKSTNVGRADRWAYNIVPDVWDYLQKHPDVVSKTSDTTPIKLT